MRPVGSLIFWISCTLFSIKIILVYSCVNKARLHQNKKKLKKKGQFKKIIFQQKITYDIFCCTIRFIKLIANGGRVEIIIFSPYLQYQLLFIYLFLNLRWTVSLTSHIWSKAFWSQLSFFRTIRRISFND